MTSQKDGAQDDVVKVLRRRLRMREVQAASMGQTADPLIQMEIEDIKEQIRQIEQTMSEETYDLVTIDIKHIMREYQQNNPLATDDDIKNAITFNNWESTSIGILSKAATPKGISELKIESISKEYYLSISALYQAEENAIYNIVVRESYSNSISSDYNRNYARRPLGFREYSYRTKLLPNSIEDVICPFCEENYHTQNISSCKHCKGMLTAAFQIYCSEVFSDPHELYSSIDIRSEFNDVNFNDYLETVFESDTFYEIPNEFPIKLSGINPVDIPDIRSKYKQTYTLYKNNEMEFPESDPRKMLASTSSDYILKTERTQSSVSPVGVRIVVDICPVYKVSYSRNVVYNKGWLSPRRLRSEITGTLIMSGTESLSTLQQSETISRSINI